MERTYHEYPSYYANPVYIAYFLNNILVMGAVMYVSWAKTDNVLWTLPGIVGLLVYLFAIRGLKTCHNCIWEGSYISWDEASANSDGIDDYDDYHVHAGKLLLMVFVNRYTAAYFILYTLPTTVCAYVVYLLR